MTSGADPGRPSCPCPPPPLPPQKKREREREGKEGKRGEKGGTGVLIGAGRLGRNKIQTWFISNSITVVYKIIMLKWHNFSEICPHFLVNYLYFCMRLLENDKFLNLQPGKKYASWGAYMTWRAERRRWGASSSPPPLHTHTLNKKVH